MIRWRRTVTVLTHDEIHLYAADPEWRAFRRNLKGEPTVMKLEQLVVWLERHRSTTTELIPRKYQVQVDNYINALRRGGYLDSEYNVVR